MRVVPIASRKRASVIGPSRRIATSRRAVEVGADLDQRAGRQQRVEGLRQPFDARPAQRSPDVFEGDGEQRLLGIGRNGLLEERLLLGGELRPVAEGEIVARSRAEAARLDVGRQHPHQGGFVEGQLARQGQ